MDGMVAYSYVGTQAQRRDSSGISIIQVISFVLTATYIPVVDMFLHLQLVNAASFPCVHQSRPRLPSHAPQPQPFLHLESSFVPLFPSSAAASQIRAGRIIIYDLCPTGLKVPLEGVSGCRSADDSRQRHRSPAGG